MIHIRMQMLTKWISGNHPLRVGRLRDAKPVFSTNTEAVLFASCQFGHSEARLCARCRNGDPITLANITLLYNVVGDVATTILLWRVPEQCARIYVQFSDLQRSFRGSRDV